MCVYWQVNIHIDVCMLAVPWFHNATNLVALYARRLISPWCRENWICRFAGYVRKHTGTCILPHPISTKDLVTADRNLIHIEVSLHYEWKMHEWGYIRLSRTQRCRNMMNTYISPCYSSSHKHNCLYICMCVGVCIVSTPLALYCIPPFDYNNYCIVCMYVHMYVWENKFVRVCIYVAFILVSWFPLPLLLCPQGRLKFSAVTNKPLCARGECTRSFPLKHTFKYMYICMSVCLCV